MSCEIEYIIYSGTSLFQTPWDSKLMWVASFMIMQKPLRGTYLSALNNNYISGLISGD